MPDTDRPWIACADRLPEPGVVVETKIDDVHGVRNVQNLKRLANGGKLWFFSDESMYCYYVPTHWRPIENGA